MGTGQKNHAMAFRLSLSALMAALGTVLMLSSNLIPVLTYVAPMLASLTLIPILTEFGKKYAWMTWGGNGRACPAAVRGPGGGVLLSLHRLVPDPEAETGPHPFPAGTDPE